MTTTRLRRSVSIPLARAALSHQSRTDSYRFICTDSELSNTYTGAVPLRVQGLPRSHRYVLQTHENEVLEADATRTGLPFHFRRILHRLVLHFLWERGVNQ